jgi:fatty-acyl-CoA synthase
VHNLIINAPAEWRQGVQGVRGMVAGAAPPAAMIEGMARIGFDITHVYGLTEVYGPAAVAVKRASWAAESLSEQTRLNGRQGVRYALQEGMTVLDPETMAPTPADGQTMGEIMFRGNIVMKWVDLAGNRTYSSKCLTSKDFLNGKASTLLFFCRQVPWMAVA